MSVVSPDTHLICVSFQIEVLPSLQRPKKITMNGSDGKLYTMLCKPKVGADNWDTGASSVGLEIKICPVWDWYKYKMKGLQSRSQLQGKINMKRILYKTVYIRVIEHMERISQVYEQGTLTESSLVSVNKEHSNINWLMCVCVLQDDLRKDCRLMEFNALVNKFLSKDPEARKRDLHIRTYVRSSLRTCIRSPLRIYVRSSLRMYL